MLDLIIYLLIENFHVQITRVVLIIPVPMAKSTNHVNKKSRNNSMTGSCFTFKYRMQVMTTSLLVRDFYCPFGELRNLKISTND